MNYSHSVLDTLELMHVGLILIAAEHSPMKTFCQCFRVDMYLMPLQSSMPCIQFNGVCGHDQSVPLLLGCGQMVQSPLPPHGFSDYA